MLGLGRCTGGCFPGQVTEIYSGKFLRRRNWYNNRLQPCRLHVMTTGTGTLPVSCGDTSQPGHRLDFLYDFDEGVANNGNVISMNDAVQNITYDYTYDELNRIDTAMASGSEVWSQDFGYDDWGNLYNIAANLNFGLARLNTKSVINNMHRHAYVGVLIAKVPTLAKFGSMNYM